MSILSRYIHKTNTALETPPEKRSEEQKRLVRLVNENSKTPNALNKAKTPPETGGMMDNVIATDNAKLIAEAGKLADIAGANDAVSFGICKSVFDLAAALEQADAQIETLEKAILAATDMLPLCPGCLHHKEAGHASGCIVETIKDHEKGDTK